MPVILVSRSYLEEPAWDPKALTYSDKVRDSSTEDIVAGEALGDGNIRRECVGVLETLTSAVVED